MKGQKKKTSLIEALINTAIGYFVALATQVIIFPWFGIDATLGQQVTIGVIFTVVSIVRGYFVRRMFNLVHIKGWL